MKSVVVLEMKLPGQGGEASKRERWKLIPVSWFGNWVDGMLSIKTGKRGGGVGGEGNEFTSGAG